MAQVHIGKKIKEVLKNSGMKSKDFAEAINLSRTNIYSIFKRETVDTGLLKQISKVLNYNFLDYLGEELPMVKDDKARYIKKTDLLSSLSVELKTCKKQLADLEKRYELLEKVNKLTEEKLQLLKGKSKK